MSFHSETPEELDRLGPEQSWADFGRLRLEYAGRINALARYWATPPAQWIGDRSPLKYPRLHTAQTVSPPVAVVE